MVADAEYQKQKEERQAKGYAWPLSMDEVRWDVEPPGEWKVNAANGLLRHAPGDECRLVRLVDLAAWLANEYPRDEVVRRLIVPLCQNEADPWGWQLFVINGKGYAKRLLCHGGASLETVDFWQHLCEPDPMDVYADCVTTDHSADEVVGVIGRMWAYAWPGVGSDPDADSDWYTQRVIEANHRRNARVAADPDASRTPASASMLSEDRKAMMRVLERLAVPIPIAFTLWGWGHAVAAVALPDAVAEAPAAPAIEAHEVVDWPSLVLNHKSLFVSPMAWPESWRRIALEFHESIRGAARGPATKKQMAEALGISRDTVDRLLDAAREERLEESKRNLMPRAVSNGRW